MNSGSKWHLGRSRQASGLVNIGKLRSRLEVKTNFFLLEQMMIGIVSQMT
jgi:hypothetical protein